jgi:C4-dicarboxylate transporter DctQ subunit
MSGRAATALKLLDRLEEGFMAFALAVMTLLTFIQVVLRYVFESGWVWSEGSRPG